MVHLMAFHWLCCVVVSYQTFTTSMCFGIPSKNELQAWPSSPRPNSLQKCYYICFESFFFRWAPKSNSFLPVLETYGFESTDVALKFLDQAHLGQSLHSLTSSFLSKILRSLHFFLFWIYYALPFISPSWTIRISREMWFSYTEK